MNKKAGNKGRPPKVYRIERDEKTGSIIIHVGIKRPAGPCWRLLSHCNLHSPTGFEIGYGGSGPADTAVSILADYFGEDRRTVERAKQLLAGSSTDAIRDTGELRARVRAGVEEIAQRLGTMTSDRVSRKFRFDD